jgi:hypothetical protein
LTMVLRYACLLPSRPAKGASGGVWLQGGIAERGFGWRQLGLSEAVVLRSETERSKLRWADAVSGRGESRPRVQGPYRRSGLARLCQARPREAGSRPSSPGRTSGRFCASWPSRPRCGSDPEAHRERGPREMRLRSSGGSPPSSTEARDQGPKHRGARRGRPHAGTACLPGLSSARPRGRGRPRLAPPLFSERRAKRRAMPPSRQAAGILVLALSRNPLRGDRLALQRGFVVRIRWRPT